MKYFIAFMLSSMLSLQSLHAADKEAVSREILTLAEIKEQTHQIALFAINEIENRKEALSAAEYNQLSTIIKHAFDEAKMYHTVERHFFSQYDAQLSPLWLDTLKSAPMRKIAALEHASAKPENFSRLNEFAQNLQATPAPQSRLDLVRKLDKVTRATSLVVASQLAVTKVLLQAINPALPSNKQMTPEQLEKLLAVLKQQFEMDLDQFATIIHLYTYQSLSDEELSQYVAHYETPQGQWITNTTYDAIMQALLEASTQVRTQTAQRPLQSPPSTLSTWFTAADGNVATPQLTN